MCAKAIQGFKCVSFRPFPDTTSCHELFIKEHSARNHENHKPEGRTLFVLNIPPYIDEFLMKKLFLPSGKVISVLFQTSEIENDGFKCGFVVFSSREGLLKALKINTLNFEEFPAKVGLDAWIEEYNQSICNAKVLEGEINAYMANFDKREAINKKDKSKEKADDEGWTVVTNKKHSKSIARKESVQIKLNQKIKTKIKKKELKNFYTFQIRESKMKNLAALRKNYEEAKKKVNLMKSSRVFKPY